MRFPAFFFIGIKRTEEFFLALVSSPTKARTANSLCLFMHDS